MINWQGYNQWVGVQYIFNLFDYFEEVCIYVIEFVDEDDVGDFGFVGVMLVGFGLGFYVIRIIENVDVVVKDFQ